MKILPVIKLLLVFVLAGTFLFMSSCTQATEQKSPPVEWNGVCSTQFQQDYIQLLNTDSNDKKLTQQCDLFYQSYPEVKCLTEIESVEVRVHTFDFDEKCNKGDFKDFKNKKDLHPDDDSKSSGKRPSETKIIPQCNEDLLSYYAKTSTLFELNKNLISAAKKNDIVFNKALTSFRQCNQFFHVYKYSVCVDDENNQRSYYELKPYCDYFESKLLNLFQKYPDKYFPEEFISLTNLKLRFILNDPFIDFYKNLGQVKKIISLGKSINNAEENKNQNYCYFISNHFSSSEKLLNQEFLVSESTKEAKNLWRLNTSTGAKSFSLYCRSLRQLYLQDLKEILGGKVHIFID